MKEALTQNVGDFQNDANGKTPWAILAKTPEDLIVAIESQTTDFIIGGNILSHSALKKTGYGHLRYGIKRYYPGGLSGLNATLHARLQMDSESKHLPRVDSDDRKYVDNGGENWSPAKNLQRQFSIHFATLRPYLRDVRHMVGIGANGHEVILYNETDLAKTLKDNGYKKSEKRTGERKNHKQKGFWSHERIETEALAFIRDHTKITDELLIDLDRRDLRQAIYRYYPRGMRGLKETLKTTQQSQLLTDYEECLISGQMKSFEEFVKGEK